MDYKDLAARGIVCVGEVVITGRNIFEPPVRFTGGNIVVNSSVGAHSTVNRGTIAMTASIGRFCSIGEDVVIGPGQHPGNWLTTHSFTYENNVADVYMAKSGFSIYKPVEIGHDVWVGSRSCIMGGVRVQHGSIVAFGAIVTKDVPPYAVVAGSPARVIKYRFHEKLIERLLAFKWWQFDLPEAIKAGLSISWKEPERALDQLEEARLAYKLPLIGSRAIAVNG